MSFDLEKIRTAARIFAAQRSGTWLHSEIQRALGGVAGGEFGEPAVIAGEASHAVAIEQFATTRKYLATEVYVAQEHGEESVGYSPAELRELAFDLLAMAEVSEIMFANQEAP